MAKAAGEVRTIINMACEECKRRNYTTYKNKRNDPDRLSFTSIVTGVASTPRTERPSRSRQVRVGLAVVGNCGII